MALSAEVIDELQLKYMNAKSAKHDKLSVSKEDVKFIIENVDNWLDGLSSMLGNPEQSPFGAYLGVLNFKEMTEFIFLIEKYRVMQVDGIITY